MNKIQKPCRDFQNGTCTRGNSCKFLHSTKNNNGRNNTTTNNNNSNNNNNNKNFNSGNGNSRNSNPFTPLQKNQNQNLTIPAHKCTNPRDCKEVMVLDLKNERNKNWPPTCYSHCRSAPSDTGFDISFEEMKYKAYCMTKAGHAFHQVIQSEKAEFDQHEQNFKKFMDTPYSIRTNQNSTPVPSSSNQNPFSLNQNQNQVQNQVQNQNQGNILFGQAMNSGSFPSPNQFNTPNQSNQASGLPNPMFGTSNPTVPAFGNPSGISPGNQQNTGLIFGNPSRTSPGNQQNPGLIFGNPSGISPGNQQNTGLTFGHSSPSGLQFGPQSPNFGGQSSNSGSGQVAAPFFSPAASGNAAGLHSMLNQVTFQQQQGGSGAAGSGINSAGLFAQNANGMLSSSCSSEAARSPNQNQNQNQNDPWVLPIWKIGEIPEEEPPVYARN